MPDVLYMAMSGDPRIENMLEYTIVLIGCIDSETGRGLSQLLPMPRDVSPEVQWSIT